MLRILIMSDSHGRNENVELAIAQVREEIGEFQMLIHLGDVGDAREIESLAGVPCYIVRGNTDYDAKLLNANVIEAGTSYLRNARASVSGGHAAGSAAVCGIGE